MAQINNHSGTTATKNLIGQPILSQIIRCIPSNIIKQAVDRGNADRYYKKIPTIVHLTSLLYGVLGDK